MNIIHISDLHFGNPKPVYSRSDLQNAFLEFIANLNADNPVLVISGDITFKGSENGFEEAKTFLANIVSSGIIPINRILVCPGNHDITKTAKGTYSFERFDQFLYSFRKDNTICFNKKSFYSLEIDDTYFLLINSASHLDHKFGFINEELYKFLEREKSKIMGHAHKVVILHHHVLNQFKTDSSAIRNAYQFLYAIDECGFELVIHGHQHAIQAMPIGNSNMQITGGRSFSFPTQGYSNGVSYYKLDNDFINKTVYQFTQDAKPTKLTLVRQ